MMARRATPGRLPRLTAGAGLAPAATQGGGEPGIDLAVHRGELPLTTIAAQACSCGGIASDSCSCAGDGADDLVYAWGSVRPVFPSLSVEKEFYQTFDVGNVPPISNQLVFQVLSEAPNLYIAREMCWVLQISGLDSLLLYPSTATELTTLISTIAPPADEDFLFTIAIGRRGPVAPPDACNGIQLPTVGCRQVYCITRDEFIKVLEVHLDIEEPEAAAAFDQLIWLTSNSGTSDADRAVNFLVLRYLGIYENVIEMTQHESEPWDLVGVNVEPTTVPSNQKVVDVILTYQQSSTGLIQRWFCRVDVTDMFPYLVTGMTRYYARR